MGTGLEIGFRQKGLAGRAFWNVLLLHECVARLIRIVPTPRWGPFIGEEGRDIIDF